MILIAFGTRPEWIKIKPLLEVFKKNNFYNYKLLFTGQHEQLINDLIFDYKIQIEDGANRLDSIFSSILNKDNIFYGTKYTLVQGDTASAYAVALASFHRQIPVIHLEAGLRTYDVENPYPEEFYRRCISNLAKINFCVSRLSENNLLSEKVPGKICVVGNTVLDNLKNIQTKYDNKILVTLHRRENHNIIEEWFKEVEKVSLEYPEYEFLLPIHPNPNVRKHSNLLNNVKVVEPLQHEELIEYMSNCSFIITDSGGLQEESSFLKKKSIVCRKTTERQEGLNTFSYLCEAPSYLKKLVESVIIDKEINLECPYGDGFSSEKIYQELKNIDENF